MKVCFSVVEGFVNVLTLVYARMAELAVNDIFLRIFTDIHSRCLSIFLVQCKICYSGSYTIPFHNSRSRTSNFCISYQIPEQWMMTASTRPGGGLPWNERRLTPAANYARDREHLGGVGSSRDKSNGSGRTARNITWHDSMVCFNSKGVLKMLF